MGKVFPIRLLGFGLYWAWLFLVTVSPSPLVFPRGFLGAPAETVELAFRLLFVALLYLCYARVETPAGRTLLVAVACLGGPAATALACLSLPDAVGLFALALQGAADAALFVLWLCFFGHMKVGETAIYMALSYLIGGLLTMAVQGIGTEAAVATAVFLPAASGLMFVFSNKLNAQTAGSEELFAAADASVPGRESHSYLRRLAVALGVAAFAFGSCSCGLYFGAVQSLASGVTIESLCCLVLGAACFATMRITRQSQDLCTMYRAVPTLMTLGLVLSGAPHPAASTAGVGLVMLGYLMFEITALNDFCIAAKAQRLPLVKTFCGARLAITGGLLLGWVAYLAFDALHATQPFAVSLGIALVAMAATHSVAFTAKEISSAHKVAEAQEKIEAVQTRLDDAGLRARRLEAFARRHGLSAREAEIALHLIGGRNINYIAGQLVIAPGTVKTHVHNIYRKTGVRNKMELLDAFEQEQQEPLG